jgi:hypothetical protein
MELTPDQIGEAEKVLADFRAAQAEERMNTGEIAIELKRDTDDPYWKDSLYRAGLKEFKESLDQAGIQYSELVIALEALGADTASLGEFTIALTSLVVPPLSKIVVAWLRSRTGNKVSLKFGDVEVKASTPEEVEHLLKSAAAFLESIDKAKKKK